MKKVFFIFLAFILIVSGIYGTYYFTTLKNAEVLINKATINIDECNFDKAISILKSVVSKYKYPVVRTTSLYYLGNAYEKKKNYNAALKSYNKVVSDKKLNSNNNWYIRSVISISRIYRKNLIKSSTQQDEILKRYIKLIEAKIKEKEEKEIGLEEKIVNIVKKILVFNCSLYQEAGDNFQILNELETELGFLCLKTGEYDKAINIFSKLNTNLAKLGLAEAYIENLNIIKGLKILEDLIKYESDGNILIYYLKTAYDYAEKLYNKKRYSNAVSLFKKIISLSKNSDYSEYSMYYLARYYYGQKSYKSALAYIDKILKNSIHLKDEEAQLLKGYIYYDKNDFILALKAFNDFIKKFPDSNKVKNAREWKDMCERNIKYFG